MRYESLPENQKNAIRAAVVSAVRPKIPHGARYLVAIWDPGSMDPDVLTNAPDVATSELYAVAARITARGAAGPTGEGR